MITIKDGKITNYDELIGRIEELISGVIFNKLPAFVRKKIGKDLKTLKDILLKSRLPKIAIIGRTQSGKSSLINCIFGEKVCETGSGIKPQTEGCKWHPFKSSHGELEILDSRGIIDDTTNTSIKESKAEKEFFNAIDNESPDIIIYLHKAREFATLVDKELNIIKKMLKKVEKKNRAEVPVVGVISYIDVMFSRSDPWPPIEHYQMIEIDAQKNAFSEKITRISKDTNLLSIFPVSTLNYYDIDGSINYKRSNNWGVESLVKYLVINLPEEAQLKMAIATRINSTLNNFANKVITIFSTLSGAIGLQPIPLADLPILTSLQLTLIITVAYIGKGRISIDDAKDFLVALGANVGIGFGMRELARALLKLIPVAGNAGSAAIAAASTYAIGKAAAAYFIDGVSIKDVKNIFKKNNVISKGEKFEIKEK